MIKSNELLKLFLFSTSFLTVPITEEKKITFKEQNKRFAIARPTFLQVPSNFWFEWFGYPNSPFTIFFTFRTFSCKSEKKVLYMLCARASHTHTQDGKVLIENVMNN